MACGAIRPGPARLVGRSRAPIWIFLGKWGGGLNREITVLGVQSSWCIRPQAFFSAFFFDWNTHFVVFSGGVERGLGGLTARSAGKFARTRAGKIDGSI